MSRDALRAAHARLAVAAQTADAAAETVQRARAAMQSTERKAAARADVDDKIAHYRTAELRAGSKPGPLPLHMIEAKRICDEAAATVEASRIALATLQQEQDDADQAEAQARAEVAQAAVAVIRFESALLGARLRELTQQRDHVLHQLQDLAVLWVPLPQPAQDGFGNMRASAPIDLPPDVVGALNPPAEAVRVSDNASWLRHLDALRGDPDATRPV